MMEETDAKLDLLCLNMLELLAAIDAKKREQEKHLQDGYLCLAKARYAIGVDRVSKLQYASEMHSSVTVECNADASFVLHRTSNSSEEMQTSTQEDTSLRRRFPPSQNKSNEDSNMKDEKPKESSTNKTDPNDPLKWFGILVPQSLRMAQASFMEGITDSCDILNLETKLNKLRFEYNEAIKLQSALSLLSYNDSKSPADDSSTESATTDESVPSVIDATSLDDEAIHRVGDDVVPQVDDAESPTDVPSSDLTLFNNTASNIVSSAADTTMADTDGMASSTDSASLIMDDVALLSSSDVLAPEVVALPTIFSQNEAAYDTTTRSVTSSEDSSVDAKTPETFVIQKPISLIAKQPSLTVEDPSSAVEESLLSFEEPPSTVEEPSPTVEEPLSTVEEPSSTEEEPGSTEEESSSTEEEPSSTVEELTSTMEEVPSMVEEPLLSFEEPQSTVEEPSLTVEEPSLTVEEPSLTVEEPSSTVEEPSSTVEEPTSTMEEVPSMVEEPLLSFEEPQSTVEEPSSTVEEPSSTVEEPTSTMEEVSSLVEEPLLSFEEPSSTTVDALTQSTDVVLQSDDVTSSTDPIQAYEVDECGSVSTESASLSPDDVIVTDEEENALSPPSDDSLSIDDSSPPLDATESPLSVVASTQSDAVSSTDNEVQAIGDFSAQSVSASTSSADYTTSLKDVVSPDVES